MNKVVSVLVWFVQSTRRAHLALRAESRHMCAGDVHHHSGACDRLGFPRVWPKTCNSKENHTRVRNSIINTLGITDPDTSDHILQTFHPIRFSCRRGCMLSLGRL